MGKIIRKENKGYFDDKKKVKFKQVKETSILERIYSEPEAVLNDDQFMLDNIVNQGFHANALMEALEYDILEIEIKGTVYKMKYTRPPFGLTHEDVMFNTKKAKKHGIKI